MFTRCAPVLPYVEISDEDDDLEDLTHEEIMTAVTSRLRAARILVTRSSDYTWRRGWRLRQLQSEREGDEAKWRMALVDFLGAALELRVTIVGRGFHVRGELFKKLYDPLSDEAGEASVWWMSITGTHGRDPGYVRQSVSRIMDKFIDEYLRVNATACRP